MLIGIFLSIIAPLFLLIGVGVAMDRRFRLDLPTLSKLNFYVFVPALSFVKLLDAELPASSMATIALFSVVHPLALLALAWVVCAHRSLKPQRLTLSLGTLFYNAGNYGIPLVLLAFGDSQIGAIATVLVVQNLLTFTLGIAMLQHKAQGLGRALGGTLKTPVVQAVALALILRGLNVPLPPQVHAPMKYLADGLIPVALLTLGVQLSRTRLTRAVLPLSVISLLRLVASPLLAALMVGPFGLTPPQSSVVIIAAGFPVAVNVYILAAEYQRDEDLASQSIFVTTLLSAVTVSLLLAWLPR